MKETPDAGALVYDDLVGFGLAEEKRERILVSGIARGEKIWFRLAVPS